LEHRFYGASLPYPLSDKAHMQQYLSVEQAIADTAAFIPYFEGVLNPARGNGSAATRQWLVVGGSYSGALVTWFTVKHGDLVAATWSSSGVVNAVYNFTAFDQTVAAAIGPQCSAAVRAVTAAFESAWNSNITALLALFGTPSYYTQQVRGWGGGGGGGVPRARAGGKRVWAAGVRECECVRM
jgi:hypothetical protein